MEKKSTKSTRKSGGYYPGLTLTESEIFDMIAKDFLTTKQIIIRRATSKQAVYKIIKKLKNKGYLGLDNFPKKEVDKIQSTKHITPKTRFRLHGQELNIKILFKDIRYNSILKKSNVIYVDGNTIRLYNHSIEIYSGHYFYSDDEKKATADSFEYWHKLIVRLESDLKVILLKPRYKNIKIVNNHYGDTQNGIAEDANKLDKRIHVYTSDDGKLWFHFDKSLGFIEGETTHSETSKQDMTKVKNFLNDLRDNEEALPSQLSKAIQEIAQAQINTQNQINILVKVLTPQQNIIEDDKSLATYFG